MCWKKGVEPQRTTLTAIISLFLLLLATLCIQSDRTPIAANMCQHNHQALSMVMILITTMMLTTITNATPQQPFVVVIPTTLNRLDLVAAGHPSRRGGVHRTVVITEASLDEKAKQLYDATARQVTHLLQHHNTTEPYTSAAISWHTYEDIWDAWTIPADLRAAVAPYLAAHVINTTTGSMPEWILYGDDDTLWVRQGLERVLKEEGMLPTQELLLSDALWFTDFQHSAAGIHSDEEDDGNAEPPRHHSLQAPRCVPCTHAVAHRLATCMAGKGGSNNNNDNGHVFAAPMGCPRCTPEVLCRADAQQQLALCPLPNDNASCVLRQASSVDMGPAPGWWWMPHGGAGAVFSGGLLARAPYHTVHDFLRDIPKHSGDGMAFEAAWNVLGVGPTSPVYSYCRPGVHLFDPDWQRHDAHIIERGGDPMGTITRLYAVLQKDVQTCDAACQHHLMRVITVHVRGRFALQQLRALKHNHSQMQVLRKLAEVYPEARGLLDLVHEEGMRVGGDYLAGSYLMMLLTRLFDAMHDAGSDENSVVGGGEVGAANSTPRMFLWAIAVLTVACWNVLHCKALLLMLMKNL